MDLPTVLPAEKTSYILIYGDVDFNETSKSPTVTRGKNLHKVILKMVKQYDQLVIDAKKILGWPYTPVSSEVFICTIDTKSKRNILREFEVQDGYIHIYKIGDDTESDEISTRFLATVFFGHNKTDDLSTSSG